MRALAIVFALLFATAAQAAEIRVLTAGAMREVESRAAEVFMRQTGHTVVISNGTVGQVQQRLREGEIADVIVVTPAALSTLVQSGEVRAGSEAVLARIGIGVGIREGAARPDISSPERFKAAMLAARSVVHMDPAVGASSGIATARIFENLGIAEQMKPKTVLQKAGYTAETVAKGEADIAIQNMSEIIPVSGVVLVGPLPAELQTYTTYAAGISSKSTQPELARAFIEHLTRPETQRDWLAAGIEPLGGR